MKKTNLLTLILAVAFFVPNLGAQCIQDIYNLIEHPEPCFFVGTVNPEDISCYDPTSPTPWKYTWRISGADDGSLIAVYHGMAFQHTFQKFGGYDFCLEIEKDGNLQNGPEITECATYTTCQFCEGADIEVEYLSCPTGYGCNIELKSSFAAENAVGLKPDATYIITYSPTYYEINGGAWEQDIFLVKTAVNYHPEKGEVRTSSKLQVPYERGCYKVRMVLDLELDAGAHAQWGGPGCHQLEVWDTETFRCIACANEEGLCTASILATEESNENGTCEIFDCTGLRSSEEGTAYEQGEFKVSPNPAKDILHLDFPAGQKEECNIHFYNMLGQPVKSVTGNPGENHHLDLNVADLPQGMFYLAVQQKGQVIFSQKIMITE